MTSSQLKSLLMERFKAFLLRSVTPQKQAHSHHSIQHSTESPNWNNWERKKKTYKSERK